MEGAGEGGGGYEGFVGGEGEGERRDTGGEGEGGLEVEGWRG